MNLHKDLNTFPVVAFSTTRHRLHAPGRANDGDDRVGCLGICLGVCHGGQACPFLGCRAEASSFEDGEPSDGFLKLH